MLVSLGVFSFLVYLAARAPVQGLPDYKQTRGNPVGEHKTLEAPGAVSLQPQTVH